MNGKDAAPFGTVIGISTGKVQAYSSFYESIKDDSMNRGEFKSFYDGIYMGYKWQCVEFVRRWLYINKGYIFEDVSMAYEVFKLKEVKHISTKKILPLYSFKNGSKRKPESASILVWKEIGEFVATGHVAIITEVLENSIRIAEQNLDHKPWENSRDWSRELALDISDEGKFYISCTFPDTEILGWLIQTSDDRYSENFIEIKPELLNLKLVKITEKQGEWLDITRPELKVYVEAMQGHNLVSNKINSGKYFLLDKEAYEEINHATNILHRMFYKATEYVLEHEELLVHFNLPSELIPRIKQSWQNRKTHSIMGRFDFSLSENGIKVYEYNTDSMGCFLECGLIHELWAQHNEIKEAFNPSSKFFDALVKSWKSLGISSKVYVLRDLNLEENYLAEYMCSAIKAAGLEAQIVVDFDDFSVDREGSIVDKDSKKVKWVWKSWAWETAIDQLRKELEDGLSISNIQKDSLEKNSRLKLFNILLHPDIMVFEPLWSLITSNKAILAILWKLYPDHPYLLETSFELSESLKKSGYVEKPIVGRCGKNITIFDSNEKILEKTSGQFAERTSIYQKFWKLPSIEGNYIQLSTFTIDGIEQGACIRTSESMIIDSESDILPLRIL